MLCPVKGALIPVLVTFTNPDDPATARAVPPDGMAAALGKDFTSMASRSRWCRMVFGRSISEGR